MKSFKQYLEESVKLYQGSLYSALHIEDDNGNPVPHTFVLKRIMDLRRHGVSDKEIGKHYGNIFNDGKPYTNDVVKDTLARFKEHLGQDWVGPKYEQKGIFRPSGEEGPKDSEGLRHAVVGMHILHGHTYGSIAHHLSADVPGINRSIVAGIINRAKKSNIQEILSSIQSGNEHPLYQKYKDKSPLNFVRKRNPFAEKRPRKKKQ